MLGLIADKLFFIYVAKNEEWQKRQQEDWDYVASMSRFFKWWTRRYFDIDLPVEADILPVIPGKLFDRMSLAYLIRDHEQRGNDIMHFYLAYFKPFWTDCNTEGYAAKNLGIAWWERPAEGSSETSRTEMFVEKNCPRISHILSHELLRAMGKPKNQYFSRVHDIWDKHVYDNLPFLYFDSRFKKVGRGSSHRFVTIDPGELL
jgi:hypothetical protein